MQKFICNSREFIHVKLKNTASFLPRKIYFAKVSMVKVSIEAEYAYKSNISFYDFSNLSIIFIFQTFKVAYRVQIWKKKAFCQNSDKFGYSVI